MGKAKAWKGMDFGREEKTRCSSLSAGVDGCEGLGRKKKFNENYYKLCFKT